MKQSEGSSSSGPGWHFHATAVPRNAHGEAGPRCFAALLGLLLLLNFTGCTTPRASPHATGRVKVHTEWTGHTARFFLRNSDTADMTATLEVGAINMQPNLPLPRTLIIPAGTTVEALVLTGLTNAGGHWSFGYTNHYTMGRGDAVHDDTHLYALPYAAGASHEVSQGHHGKFSHTGADEFALDWKMPEGTTVLAARAGTVVAVKDDSEQGGPRRKFEGFANHVTIQHADGTMAHYCHLAPRSAQVRVGDAVAAGTPLAASGNTGFSSGPHLHFAVFKARGGYARETIPVKFLTAEGRGITPVTGESYRAVDTSALAQQ